LLVVRSLINECPDRGSYREKESSTMTTFTIDNDNNITAHATAAEAKALAGTERFSNEAALAKLAANWTAARLVEIHNTLTGVTPVKKFKDRNTGAARIWTAIQNLDQPAATKEAQEPASEAEPQPEASVEEAPVGEAAQPAVAPEPTPEQPATVAPDAQQTPDAAPVEAPAKKKATRAKKAPVAKEAGEPKGARAGSKTETILGLMKQPGGTTLKAIMEATQWQAHSVRGFISGTLGKKMGLTVVSAKGDNGERSYSISA
jgi:outer membrane biosynthesis protein TonB